MEAAMRGAGSILVLGACALLGACQDPYGHQRYGYSSPYGYYPGYPNYSYYQPAPRYGYGPYSSPPAAQITFTLPAG
jgi:hypothetical protein